MKKILLPEAVDGIKYYRANLHCHSTISDGGKTPEQLKADYKKNGYSILSITDHDLFVTHNDMSDDEFLMLNGYELEVNGSGGRTCHVCLVALDPNMETPVCYHRTKYARNDMRHLVKNDENEPDFEREYTPECINEMIKKGVDSNFFVTYNHPVWSLETYPEYMSFEGMHAMEIVNYASIVAGWDDDNGHCYEDMLRGGKKLYCIGADDNHNRVDDSTPRCGSYGGYIQIASPSLTYGNVAKALVNGDFYAGQGDYANEGPRILSLYVKDKRVHIKTSAARMISFMPDIRANKAACAVDGESIYGAEFEIPNQAKWFRIVVTDNKGYKAYTNAYFTEDLK